MTILPVYLLLLLVFTNRYFGGLFLKSVKGARFDEANDGYEPTVTVVVPLYNEGKGIVDTIESLLAQEYPSDKLDVTVVDDCSSDDSYAWALAAAARHPGRVTVLRNAENVGKRRGINHAVRRATAEIIVSVDSDVVVEPTAVRRLVARFVRPEIGAVGGRVVVSNARENWLTRMQAIKYYFGYEYLKNLERAFASVMCLSGCLTAYRRHVLLELEPILERRNVLDVPIKYGEDRYLTRQIVKAGYQTLLTLDAVCWTVAPGSLSKYFAQQLRWRRSNIVDFFAALSHAWKLHPVVALHHMSLFAMLLAYPVVVMSSIADGEFFALAAFHGAVLAVFGVLYWWGTRDYPESAKVHPAWFLPMAAVMPVTYVLYTTLALFTLDSSNWGTRPHSPGATDAAQRGPGDPGREEPPAGRGAGNEETRGGNMSMKSPISSAALPGVVAVPRTLTPKWISAFVVSAYRVMGFAILTFILLGLGSYLTANAFYLLNRSWIAPTILSPTDERVLALTTQLAHEASLRDKLAADRREMVVRLEHERRVLAMERGFQESFRRAIQADMRDRSEELRRLSPLVAAYGAARKESARTTEAYVGLSEERMRQLFDAHIVDQDALVNASFQLTQRVQSSLSLQETEVGLDRRVASLSRHVRALGATASTLSPDSGNRVFDLSYEVLQIKREFEKSVVEGERARAGGQALEEGIRRIDETLGRYDRITRSIEESPYVKAAAGNLTIAFVPYENLESLSGGEAVYGCRLGFVWCSRVGVVVRALPGEVVGNHPIHNRSLRGRMVQLSLEETGSAQKPVLYFGRAPVLL